MNKAHTISALLAITLAGGLDSCRGGISTEPPIHLVPDMDFQPKYRAQAANPFFADGRAMRMPVPGTVARGSLVPIPKHKNADGSFVTTNPVAPSGAVLARGRERFMIHCTPCHGKSGRGGRGNAAHGTVGRLWPEGVVIPSFIDDERVSTIPDGEIYEVITNGKTTMPSYQAQVTPADRWAIIHYIRALQYQAENQ